MDDREEPAEYSFNQRLKKVLSVHKGVKLTRMGSDHASWHKVTSIGSEGGTIHPGGCFICTIHEEAKRLCKKNKAKPEGSIAEGYVAEEALTLSSYYFRDVTMKFNRLERNVDPPPNVSVSGVPVDLVAVTRQKPISKTPRGLANITSELFALANGPSRTPMSVNACVVDGVRYVVQSRDERRTTQNSGICAPGPDGEMSYGQLQEILEFKYLSFKVALFRVKWFDTRNNGRADSDVEDSSMMMTVLRKFILVKKKINLVLWMMLLRAHGGDGGGEDLHVHLPYIILGKKKKEAKAQFGRVKSRRQEDPGKDPEPRIKGLRSTYNLEPHIRSERWPRIEGYIQAQFGKSYNTNKATLKREHWIRTPELELMIWIGSGGANRMESRHDDPEALRMYDRMRELEATGEHTTAEINAMVRGGKLRGHIPGVGPVMPGYVRSRLSYTAPVDRSRDVDFMMSLMRSDNRFADAFARYDSGGASGSGGSRARDREDGDDTGGEDGGDDTIVTFPQRHVAGENPAKGQNSREVMSLGNLLPPWHQFLDQKIRGAHFSLGIVAGERFAIELTPSTFPQRHFAGDIFPQRHVAGEGVGMLLGKASNVVV
ncbi:putative receptor-like protein kinase [Tanacetum coccineum]